MLEDLVRALEARRLRLVIAEMKTPARAKLTQYALGRALPEDRFYPTLATAVQAYRTQSGQDCPAEGAQQTDE